MERTALPLASARYQFGGRVAIVTGASSGMGRAVTLRLAAEGAALSLVAAPADAGALERVTHEVNKYGSGAIAIPGDVADADTAARAVSQSLEALGDSTTSCRTPASSTQRIPSAPPWPTWTISTKSTSGATT